MTEVKREWDNMARIGYSKYSICRAGEIKNDKTNHVLQPNPDERGYVRPWLRNDEGKGTMPYMHILMAKMYIPNTDRKPTVDHIDRNRSNNKLENLRWATGSEQGYNREAYEISCRVIIKFDLSGNPLRKYKSRRELQKVEGISSAQIAKLCKNGQTANNSKWQFEDETHIHGEQFFKVPDDTIEEVWASNFGRVFIMRNRRATWGIMTAEKYMCTNVRPKNTNNENKDNNNEKVKPVHKFIHRLVISAFKGNDSRLVNHINGIRNDNRIENLEYVTQSENMTHAVKQGTIKSIPVIQMDKDGNFIAEYESICQASRSTGINNGRISQVCNIKKHQLAGGFKWKFKE